MCCVYFGIYAAGAVTTTAVAAFASVAVAVRRCNANVFILPDSIYSFTRRDMSWLWVDQPFSLRTCILNSKRVRLVVVVVLFCFVFLLSMLQNQQMTYEITRKIIILWSLRWTTIELAMIIRAYTSHAPTDFDTMFKTEYITTRTIRIYHLIIMPVSSNLAWFV